MRTAVPSSTPKYCSAHFTSTPIRRRYRRSIIRPESVGRSSGSAHARIENRGFANPQPSLGYTIPYHTTPHHTTLHHTIPHHSTPTRAPTHTHPRTRTHTHTRTRAQVDEIMGNFHLMKVCLPKNELRYKLPPSVFTKPVVGKIRELDLSSNKLSGTGRGLAPVSGPGLG